MEILHDAAAQERLQVLDWRIPAAAFKHRGAEQHRTNGVSADKTGDQQGTAQPLRMDAATLLSE